mmetsp:Transcript_25648/g.36176  ORF Transcript_25648/g.36176 Transcript_25648/m.36176 type:complete len:602 (-) Transcript_25648:43-1848(-)
MMHHRAHQSTNGGVTTSNGNDHGAAHTSTKQRRVPTPTTTAHSSSVAVANGGVVEGVEGSLISSSSSLLLENRKSNRIRRKRRQKQPKSAFSTFYGHKYNNYYDKGSMMQLTFIGIMLLSIIAFGIRNLLFSSNSYYDKEIEEIRQRTFSARLRNSPGGGGHRPNPHLPNPHPHKKGWLQSMFQNGPSFYAIPGAMKDVGDKSVDYAKLRKEFDELLPRGETSTDRQRKLVQSLKHERYDPMPQDSYDIHNCPFDPPQNYPFAWNIIDILENWPPDDPKPRPDIYQALCVFDYETDYDKAMNYRKKELPFITQNDPDVLTTVERWNTPTYMDRMLSNVKYRTEHSINNHFMYWVPPKKKKKGNKHGRQELEGPPRNNDKNKRDGGGLHWKPNSITRPNNWTAPTQMMRMSFQEWLDHANVTDDKLGPDQPHWYFRLIGCGAQGQCDKDSSEYLFDELTFFQPRESLYMVEPNRQKGIHCRFGMKGVIAENHFDGSRNFIVVLGGSRRYILSHPNQCQNLALLPKEHPSGRHSAVDWSDPDLESYPQFEKAVANEVVLQPGDTMYLPTNWFHYIISLELNFQCNTRSGISSDYMQPIHDCGF